MYLNENCLYETYAFYYEDLAVLNSPIATRDNVNASFTYFLGTFCSMR
jgi:hypothetical protein